MPQEFREVLPFATAEEVPESDTTVKVWDYFGLTASFLCIVDCVVLPIVSSLMVFADMIPSLDVHLWLYPAILVTATIAFSRSYRKHKNRTMLALAVGGCTGLIGSLLVPPSMPFLSGAVSLLGGAALVAAHGMNLYHFKKHPHCNHA